MNRLLYGDNLPILRERIKDESVDLIYLDPPFNSNRSYNVLFKSKSGEESQAQIEAFDDTWSWSQQADAQYEELVSGGSPIKVADAMQAMRKLLGTNDVLAYLVMMTARLVELHSVLKPTGSLYLHCDPTASHYLKVILDAIFGPTNFRNEIIWRRTGTHGKVKRFGPTHDVILFYAKSTEYKYNRQRKRYMKKHVQEYFEQDEKGWRTKYYGNVLTGSGLRGGESGKPWMGFDPSARGRHWAIPGALLEHVDEDLTDLSQHQKLDRLYQLGYIKIVKDHAWPIYEHYIQPDDGTAAPDIWAYQPYTEGTVFGTDQGIDADVRWLNPKDGERLGYPTQKPLGLLERIIRASSDEGDVVLDPFCGCGTAVDAAQKLGRKWIGIDVTTLSVDLIQRRLKWTYGEGVAKTYKVEGIPTDIEGAERLFAHNAFEFERWVVLRIDGEPNQRQVGDRGVDGRIRFFADKDQFGQVLVSVKGGKQLNPAMVRDLVGTVQQEGAEMGLLVTMAKPTPGMIKAAKGSGSYLLPMTGSYYPKVQIISVQELLAHKVPNMPTPISPHIKARRSKASNQQELF